MSRPTPAPPPDRPPGPAARSATAGRVNRSRTRKGRAVKVTGLPEWEPGTLPTQLLRLRGGNPKRSQPPGLDLERRLWADGHEVVVGLDEVGRGAWAGPLAIGAAVLPRRGRVNGVRDSKLLTEPEREKLFTRVAGWCEVWAVGMASPRECDLLGMSAAQKLAATRALDGLGLAPGPVLVDGSWDFVERGTTVRVVKGDATVLSIAAASILAKVSRDRLMRADAEHFPGFDFDRNKGYPCPRHKLALRAYGPTAIHRITWAFMGEQPGDRWYPGEPRRPLSWMAPDDGDGQPELW